MISKKYIILICGYLISYSLTLLSMREYYNPHAIQIGIYNGAGYNFLTDVRGNIGDENLSVDSLPQEIRDLIPAGAEIKNYLILLGAPETKSSDSVYNIAYHPTVKGWFKKNPAIDSHNFSVPIAMGIFEPQGVAHVNSAEGIAFNGLSAQQVIIHPGVQYGTTVVDAYSPNNARFQINPKNKISSFWTMAISPDKKQIYTAYVILVQDDLLEKEIVQNINLGLDQLFSKTISSKHIDLRDKKILEYAYALVSAKKALMHTASLIVEEKASAGGDIAVSSGLTVNPNAGLSEEEALAQAVKNSMS